MIRNSEIAAQFEEIVDGNKEEVWLLAVNRSGETVLKRSLLSEMVENGKKTIIADTKTFARAMALTREKGGTRAYIVMLNDHRFLIPRRSDEMAWWIFRQAISDSGVEPVDCLVVSRQGVVSMEYKTADSVGWKTEKPMPILDWVTHFGMASDFRENGGLNKKRAEELMSAHQSGEMTDAMRRELNKVMEEQEAARKTLGLLKQQAEKGLEYDGEVVTIQRKEGNAPRFKPS